MIGVLKPTSGGARLIDVSDATFAWHVFGGPSFAEVPGRIAEVDKLVAPGGRLEGYGPWGIAWDGFVVDASRDEIRADGLQRPFATVLRSEMRLCDTSTSAWHELTNTGRATEFWRIQADGPYIRFIGRGTAAVGDTNGVYYRKEAAGKSYVVIAWARPTTDERITLYWDTYDLVEATGHEAGGAWAYSEVIAADGSGALSGTYTKQIDESHDVISVQARYSGDAGTRDRIVRVQIKVYGVDGVTDISPANVIGAILDEAPTHAVTDGVQIADIGDVIEPLILPAGDMGAWFEQLLRYQASRWSYRRAAYGKRQRMAGVFDALPSTPKYRIDVSETGADDFGTVSISDAATHALVRYRDESGAPRTLTVAAAASYLTTIGQEQWIEISADTSSTTVATRLGTIALAERAYGRQSGTIPVRWVRDYETNTRVPLEHLLCGELVAVDGLAKRTTPRLIGYSLSQGEAALSLDTSPDSLEIALARLPLRAGSWGYSPRAQG